MTTFTLSAFTFAVVTGRRSLAANLKHRWRMYDVTRLLGIPWVRLQLSSYRYTTNYLSSKRSA